MSRYLYTLILLAVFCSCTELEKYETDLSEEGKAQAEEIIETWHSEKQGVYYMEIDTATGRLFMRYDQKLTQVDSFETYLAQKGFLYVEVVDTVVTFPDSLNLSLDTIPTETGETEVLQKEESDEELEKEEDREEGQQLEVQIDSADTDI